MKVADISSEQIARNWNLHAQTIELNLIRESEQLLKEYQLLSLIINTSLLFI